MLRQGGITYGGGPTDGHVDGFFFRTDGANNPTDISPNLDTVTRITSAGGSDLYRLRFREAYPFTTGVIAESWEVTQPETVTLDADRVLGALVGAIPTEEDVEIDIRVIDRATDAVTNSVAAGSTVSGFVYFDAVRE